MTSYRTSAKLQCPQCDYAEMARVPWPSFRTGVLFLTAIALAASVGRCGAEGIAKVISSEPDEADLALGCEIEDLRTQVTDVRLTDGWVENELRILGREIHRLRVEIEGPPVFVGPEWVCVSAMEPDGSDPFICIHRISGTTSSARSLEQVNRFMGRGPAGNAFWHPPPENAL